MPNDSLFIGGIWSKSRNDAKMQVTSAADGRPLGSVPESTEADVDRAVDAARSAFDEPGGWAQWESRRRADAMMRLADALEARNEQTSEVVTLQNGMPISTSRAFEGAVPAMLLRYFAGLVTEETEEVHPGVPLGVTRVRHAPAGVVADIMTWNFPQVTGFFKIAPALAAGCTLVLKPAPQTVLDSVLLAEAVVEAGLPAGVVNIVPGGGAVGSRLISHSGVDRVSFTGSTAVGRRIAESCASLLRPVTLELGGKSAAIVLDDVDLACHAEQLFAASFLNNGQACYACSRILAPRHRYQDVVDFYTGLAGAAVLGDPMDPETQIGPLVSSAQRDHVEECIRIGREEGARITTGGHRPPGYEAGWYVEPTVLSEVDNASAIAREEIFGPVVTVTPYGSEDEAVRLADESPYGLAGTVWSEDPDHAEEVAGRIHTGTVGVNGYLPDVSAPYGGTKASGMGRELGLDGLRFYQETQSVYRY